MELNCFFKNTLENSQSTFEKLFKNIVYNFKNTSKFKLKTI